MPDATLDLLATLYSWQCSNCHALFDAMWRPVALEKVWAPPVTYQWTADKPDFNYCPHCGACFRKEPACGEAVCEIRV